MMLDRCGNSGSLKIAEDRQKVLQLSIEIAEFLRLPSFKKAKSRNAVLFEVFELFELGGNLHVIS